MFSGLAWVAFNCVSIHTSVTCRFGCFPGITVDVYCSLQLVKRVIYFKEVSLHSIQVILGRSGPFIILVFFCKAISDNSDSLT